MKFNIPSALAQQVEGRRVKATSLALLTPEDVGLSTAYAFKKYVIMFTECDVFESSMAPFISQSHGPDWFKRCFPPLSPDHQEEALDIWSIFLRPSVLSSRILLGSKGLGLVSY